MALRGQSIPSPNDNFNRSFDTFLRRLAAAGFLDKMSHWNIIEAYVVLVYMVL
jgi:hypothetical protein